MSRLRARLRIAAAWLPAVAYTLLIWWLSSQAIDMAFLARVPFHDKGVHFLEYGALGIFIAFAVDKTWGERGLGSIATATLITTMLGLLDELHQAFVPARSGDVLDLVADFAGALTAALLYAGVRLVVRMLGTRRERLTE